MILAAHPTSNSRIKKFFKVQEFLKPSTVIPVRFLLTRNEASDNFLWRVIPITSGNCYVNNDIWAFNWSFVIILFYWDSSSLSNENVAQGFIEAHVPALFMTTREIKVNLDPISPHSNSHAQLIQTLLNSNICRKVFSDQKNVPMNSWNVEGFFHKLQLPTF